jgi:DNA-binding NarL/FixJ family response regulator
MDGVSLMVVPNRRPDPFTDPPVCRSRHTSNRGYRARSQRAVVTVSDQARGRHDPDFSDRDRALLTLLRPHLYNAHVDVLRRRCGIPKLTDRQWQLLHLVDAGLSNTQIARRLSITDNTVRKHLENIFERLQVQNRTAALARAFPERALLARRQVVDQQPA